MKLNHFEAFNYDKLFCYILTLCKVNLHGNKSYVLYLIEKLFYSILFKSLHFTIVGNKINPICLFVTESRLRSDMSQMLNNLIRAIGSDFCCECRNTGKISFSFLRSFYLVYADVVWLWQLRKSYSLIESLPILFYLNNFMDIRKDLDICFSKTKPIHTITRYDSSPYMNYIAQYMRILGVSTSTLQHGIMLAARPELAYNLDFMGVEFNGFVSDFFLVWNDFTKHEAIKQGIPENKIKVLGCVKCLYKPNLPDCKNGIIGVLLDGFFEKENNIPMITLVKRFSMKYNYHYILRYHPAFNGNEYNDFLDENGENCHKEMSLEDFLASIEFCVLANSTTLFELEYYHKKFMRYSSSNKIADKYRDYPVACFSDYNDMTNRYMEIQNCQEEFIMDDNLITNYRDFYIQYTKKQ